MGDVEITVVTETDLDDVLPLLRGYTDFYGVEPSDEMLRRLSQSLLADPECEGFQLIARENEGSAIGFATVYWSWSTLSASRIAIMNDLFVAPGARGAGVADRLIEECRSRARDRGATSLTWQTAKDNHRARRVYERVGGRREEWLHYSLGT